MQTEIAQIVTPLSQYEDIRLSISVRLPLTRQLIAPLQTTIRVHQGSCDRLPLTPPSILPILLYRSRSTAALIETCTLRINLLCPLEELHLCFYHIQTLDSRIYRRLVLHIRQLTATVSYLIHSLFRDLPAIDLRQARPYPCSAQIRPHYPKTALILRPPLVELQTPTTPSKTLQLSWSKPASLR